ncbi:MAG: hypothetical protein E7295_03215 [Lachnospiraceae bacterium]|nr:hypothetical protein [Lachnospiraceae bacterium]
MTKERVFGIDNARIIATFLIIISHLLSQGGLLSSFDNSTQYIMFRILKCFAFPALNMYLLISGYVGLGSKHSIKRLFSLYVEVFFYSLIITCVFMLIHNYVSFSEIIKAILPVMSKQYWYFSAYFFAFFIFPYIDMVLEHVTEELATKNLVGLFILASIVGTCARLFGDPFGIINGYSPLWMCIMYYFGGYIRKYENGKIIRFLQKKAILVYLFSTIVSLSSVFAIRIVNSLCHTSLNEGTFLSYITPFAVLASVSMLLLCLKRRNNKENRIITNLSKLTFGVYLIHVHPIIWSKVIKDSCIFLLDINPIVSMFMLIALAALVFAILLFLDYIRELLFKSFRVNKVLDILENKFSGRNNRLI